MEKIDTDYNNAKHFNMSKPNQRVGFLVYNGKSAI